MKTTTVTTHLQQYASNLAGNWQRWSNFVWFGDDRVPDPENWAIVYTHNRDSTIIDESNAAQIAKIMAPFLEADDSDILKEDHNHWACGWIAGYAIRCLRDGQPTPAIVKWKEIQDNLKRYPILNEDDFQSGNFKHHIS